jgi:beta-lactamase superfamily II metal-dependent hydrolase
MSEPSRVSAPLTFQPGCLNLYLLGSGFGESQVVLLPDGRCLVADSCKEAGANLTTSLLRRLQVRHIDLLVVTHFDLDHVRGLPELVQEFKPRQVWRPPRTSLRELVSFWCRQDPTDARLQEVYEAFVILDELEQQGVVHQVGVRNRPWKPSGADYEVLCIAPASGDVAHSHLQLRQLVERQGEQPVLGRALQEYLRGERALGDRANLLSLALAVRWGERRILLGGDVENGRAREPYSGWKGILQHLEEDGLLEHVRSVDLVKVAHHGSEGAFHAAAWELHARETRDSTALVTPFSSSALPPTAVLRRLLEHVGRLGLSADEGGAFGRAEAAGWGRQATPALPEPGCCLAVVLGPTGPAHLYAGERAAFFRTVGGP